MKTKTMRLTTSEAALRLGVTPGSLRALDRRGIFPARRDWSNRRVYAESDFPRLREIVGLPPERDES